MPPERLYCQKYSEKEMQFGIYFYDFSLFALVT